MGCGVSSDADVRTKDLGEGVGTVWYKHMNPGPRYDNDKQQVVEKSMEWKRCPRAHKMEHETTQEENQTDQSECSGDTDSDTIRSTALITSTFTLDYAAIFSPESTPSSSSKTVVIEEQREDENIRLVKNHKNQNEKIQETEAVVVDTSKKADEIMTDVHEDSDKATRALLGDIDMTCPSPTKIVRIFTSSTFTDTKNERNMLMKHAYPKVKEYCRRIGYEFQVVDMRWGVRDEATDDHMGTELCLKELKLCQEVSTGPNFVSFLSHKYGYTAFPRVIEAGEFETIMSGVDGEESKTLFQRWYTLDNNAVPPAYILSSISSRLPDFISSDGEKKKQAKQIWWDESEKMQNVLDVTATKIFDKETARKYIMSVTETEVTEGLLKLDNPSKHSLWFKRDIEDIEEQESCYLLSRYMECTGPDEKWKKSRNMLRELKEEKITKKLSADRIITYKIKWNKTSGVNPDEDTHHKEYLDKLCVDFVAKMKDIIDEGVAERERTDDNLLDECCQHIRFCQSKCKGFKGRQDTLKLIEAYVKSSSSEPLVLHGTSGTGKTSIMAMAAKMMKQWTSHPPVLLLRFLGTTPDSSSIIPLLESLTSQIHRIYKMPPLPLTAVSNLDARIKEFEEALRLAQPDKPLILMLDSLDQLDPAYDARQMDWLVTTLAPGTKVIVSTLPEPIYECYPALQAELKSESSFVSVPVLDNSDVKIILDNWLTMRHRRLTNHQMTTVLDAFKKCSTPLFLKLSFDEASIWTSFMPADKTVLQDTVRASIDFLFQKVEKVHGKLLVSRALGYLTIANNGATEAELEDILSCDDDVLNDVYMYWTPPIRRLPPLLLVRIRTDLNQYLVERGADGVRVIYWYHRQFIEAAETRYCSDKDTNRLIHERLADFFNGTWANGKKKPYTSAKGESGEEDRHSSSQPLKFGPDTYNLRTLNNLPYHRINAGQVTFLKDQCLANPTFLIYKLEAAPFFSVLRDYTMAKEMFPDDVLIQEVLEALNLSQKALTTDAKQLVPQMLQRLNESSATKQLLERCKEYPSTYILPTKRVLERPGGQLVHSISAHRKTITTMDMTTNGKLIATACRHEKTVKLWDVDGAKKRREAKGLEGCSRVFFCNYDSWLACGLPDRLVIQTVDTGVNVITLHIADGPCRSTFCPFGKGRTFVMQLIDEEYKLINLLDESSEEQTPQTYPDQISFDDIYSGSDNYLAVTVNYQMFITVYDLAARKFRPSFRGFPMIPDKYDPEEMEETQVVSIVISRDESYLIYSADLNNGVAFADLDGILLRTIPPVDRRWYKDVNLTLDGSLLYITDMKVLRFFEINTLQEVGTLEQQREIKMAVTHDAVNVFTVSDDGNIRIWDRTRTDKSKEDASSQFATKLFCFHAALALNNPRYVLLCGHCDKDGLILPNLRLEVYDVFTNTIAKHGEMRGETDGESLTCKPFRTKNDHQVILVLNRKQIVRVDLQTMRVVKNYDGFTSKVTMSEDTEEIFCTTRNDMHMKLYDKHGDFVTVMKVGQKESIDKIHINSTGTFGCALTYKGPLMLYDIKNRKHMYNIEPGSNKGRYFAESLIINKAGIRLVFASGNKIAGVPIMDDIDHMVLWDIQENKEIRKLYDAESQSRYKATMAEMTVGLGDLFELDNTRLLSTHITDYVMRIWNIHTGEMLAQMRGHVSPVQLTLCEKSPYMCSYGSSGEDDRVRLWDKTTYQCVASFLFDKTVTEMTWSVDGKFLTSSKFNDPPDVTMWKVYHGHNRMTVDENDYQQIFSQKEETTETMEVKLYKHNPLEMVGDPDSDLEETSKMGDDVGGDVAEDVAKDDGDDDDNDNDDDDGGDERICS